MKFLLDLFNRKYLEEAAADDGTGGGTGGGGAGGADGTGGGTGEDGAGGADGNGTGGDGGASAGGDDTPTGGDWPENWRGLISADEKHAKTLERFASPKALFDSYQALRQRMDSGELQASTPFPTEGTDEDKAAWRKAHDIPEKPEGYLEAMGEGLVVSEEDQPLVDSFLESMHQVNMSSDQAAQALNWFYAGQEKAAEKQEAEDDEYLLQSEDTLRSEWGQDYRRNINLIKGLVDTIPDDVRGDFTNARLANGRALLSNPDIARWLVDVSRQVNPVATVVPGAGANAAAAVEDEITSIEKVMREDRPRYNRDTKMQERLRELYTYRDKAKA